MAPYVRLVLAVHVTSDVTGLVPSYYLTLPYTTLLKSWSGRPVEIHGWGDGLKLGQVSAVDVNEDDDPVILHRG